MNPSDIPTSSQAIMEVPTTLGIPIEGRRSSTRVSDVRSSSKLSRNSSTSRSIKIFADMKNLLSIRSSHIRLPAQAERNSSFRSLSPSIYEADSNKEAAHSVSNEQTAESTKSDEKADSRTSRGPEERQSPTVFLDEAGRIAGSLDLYHSFPSPPGQVLLNPSHRLAQHESLGPEPGLFGTLRSDIREKEYPRVDKLLPAPPYHSFTHKKKLMIAILVSLSGSLSPLSSVIYFPALNAISSNFNVSKELVLLTITAFMLVQGLTPVLRMPFENIGRRPVLIGTLFFFSGASIGLVYNRGFTMLLVFRAIQGGGSAALTAIGASVIGDISESKEREELMGMFGAVLIGSHFVSPVIGGALTHFLGFRSIFWVLFVFAATLMVLIILLLPETLRSIAGNGTIKLGLIHRPLWWMFKSRDSPFNPTTDALSCRPSLAALAEPFKCLKQKNLVASIIFGSVIYAVWTAVLSTTTLLFEPRLHTSTLLVGLAFLPSGAGSVMSFYLTGYIMDRDYSIVETRYRESHNIDQNSTVDPKSSANFPIYRARLRSLWRLALIFIIATSGYGFSFLSPSVAAPLVLQFFVAFSATAVLFLNGVLVANIYPGPSASVIAIMNLIRFSCGALAVGTVQLLFTRLGFGFTFLTLAMIALAFMPILLVQWVFATERKSETVSWWRWPSRFMNFD